MHFFRTCAFKGIIAKGASVQGTFPPEILVGERVNIEVVHAVITPVHELVYNLYPFTYSGLKNLRYNFGYKNIKLVCGVRQNTLRILWSSTSQDDEASTRNSAREERLWKGSE